MAAAIHTAAMNNPSGPDNVVHPQFAADSLRVEYSIKVTGAAGPFMDWQGMFDLPSALDPTGVELASNHFGEFLKRMVLQGASRRFCGLLQERATKALAALEPAAVADPVPRSPILESDKGWQWGSAPTGEKELTQADLEAMNPLQRAVYERRKEDRAHQREVMETLAFAGNWSRSKPASATRATSAAPSAAPATQTPSEPSQRSPAASSAPPPPASVATAAPPKTPRQKSEAKQPAPASAPIVPPAGIWDEPPLQKAA